MRVAVVFFGGQYNRLILRRLLELGVDAYSIDPDVPADELNADALVLGGGPQSVPSDLPRLGRAPEYVTAGIPVLGICLSHQLIAHVLGGRVGPSRFPEFGEVLVEVTSDSALFDGVPKRFWAWESHNDEVLEPPREAAVTASSESCRVQALEVPGRLIFGVQFHPEVTHTEHGTRILENFVRAARR